MTPPSRRRLLCRELPSGLAALIGLFRGEDNTEASEQAAYAAFDAEWRAMGPDMLAQAARAAGVAESKAAGGNRDDLVKALWQRTRIEADVG
ncbi:MAG: hypothetical protein WAS73_08415 [Defluviicoccus sp.]